MIAYICPACGSWGFFLDDAVWCKDCGAELPGECWTPLNEAATQRAKAAQEGIARSEVERCRKAQLTLQLHTRGPLELNLQPERG